MFHEVWDVGFALLVHCPARGLNGARVEGFWVTVTLTQTGFVNSG